MMQHITIEELKQKAGQTWLVMDYPIERELLKRFTSAVGDTNPRWQDNVPPSLLFTIGLEQVSERLVPLSQAVLHGSTEIEYIAKVKVGDNITVVADVEDVRERPPFTFLGLKIEQHNQNGTLVVRCKQMIVLRSLV
ncbi:MAG: MaoC family dehydratase N-terminal domain-containing protein [Dehalococcoidia bacterium]|nr:MaoC family dehydratase N-terminal domain-containing protein [Dehalococcoidia bacterium]